jgi:AraC-like DNA-binding protein
MLERLNADRARERKRLPAGRESPICVPAMRSDYREFPPPPALADHLVCVWAQTVGDAPRVHRVLPDACADIVFVGAEAPVVAGPATQPVILPFAPGTTIVGARFRPGAAPTLLRAPADALRDRDVALRDLWGPVVDTIWERVASGASAVERLAALTRALIAHRDAAWPADRLVDAGTAWLARHPARPVATLARALDVSERHLRRRFIAAVGYGPKTLQRILRLQALLHRAQHAPAGLAALAADLGYADQAHMTREVRALSGLAPRTLLQRPGSTLALSDLFNPATEDAA